MGFKKGFSPSMGRSKGKHKVSRNESSGRDSSQDQIDEIEEWSDSSLSTQWHCYVAAGLFLGIYLKCTSPSIPSGDAGDFIMAAQHFGVAHPPGYPLYVTVGYFWMKILPFGSPAYKLNLLTAIIGGLAAFIVYLTTYKITNFVPSAVFASGMFAFSHLIWFHSIGAEIFSLNNLFCGVLLYWVVRFDRAAVSDRARVAMEASFLSGLSMCNQHTSILYIAVTGGWMFISLLRDKAITLNQFVWTGIMFALGLIPYLQLPISAYFAQAPSTWGDHRTFSGVWKHFMREEYGTFRLTAEDDQTGDIVRNLRIYLGDMVTELGASAAILSVLCVVLAWKIPRISTIVKVYAMNVTVYLLFFCNQANMNTANQVNLGVLERFWMQANITVSILSGCGLWCVYYLITKHYTKGYNKTLYCVFTAVAVLSTALQIKSNYTLCDMSNNYIIRDYGMRLLDGVPRNGVLLLSGDTASISAHYLRYSENYRADVDVLDQELIGFNWYKTMCGHRFNHFIFPYHREVYFKEVETRRGEKEPFSYNFLDVFNVHKEAGTPVYVFPIDMKEGDEDWKEKYELVPSTTTIFEVRSKEDQFSIEEFLDKAEQQKHDNSIQNCDNTLYHVRSWEHGIATKCGNSHFIPPEYIHIKFTEDRGASSKPQNRPIMIRIFNLYKRARDALTVLTDEGTSKHMFLPTHHENYATIAFQLYSNYLSTKERLEAGKYARVMIEQLEIYMSRNSDINAGSNDFSNIRNVLVNAKREFPDWKTNPAYDME